MKATSPEEFAKKLAPPNGRGCRLWNGSRDSNGYGLNGKDRAHRSAWEFAHGPIPDALCVCHQCDVPLCCEITHLWLGTQAQNMADMFAKGRQANHTFIGPFQPPDLAVAGALKVSAAAAFLGVSRRTVYVLMERGDLVFSRVGRLRLIPLVSLRRLLARGLAVHETSDDTLPPPWPTSEPLPPWPTDPR